MSVKCNTEPRGYTPGRTFRDKLKTGGKGPLMVVIPCGHFLMGSPPDELERKNYEGPQHEVNIAQPFAMGIYTVTFDDYDRFCQITEREKPNDPYYRDYGHTERKNERWGRGKQPVINVTWHDAQEYCDWLSEQTGYNYRLPSEAEWEYACRAGTNTPFHTGVRITTRQANFNGNHTYNGSEQGVYLLKPEPVGSYSPNAFGLHEMHGNVWEWCHDIWHDSYKSAPTDGSPWVDGTSEFRRVLRGGCHILHPGGVRSSYRSNCPPEDCYGGIGFRIVCPPH